LEQSPGCLGNDREVYILVTLGLIINDAETTEVMIIIAVSIFFLWCASDQNLIDDSELFFN